MSIAIESISFSYDQSREAKPLLVDLSLTIQSGERVGIIGRNGSGKTTLAKHMNGLLTPTKGSVSVDGVTLTAAHGYRERKAQRKIVHELHRKVGYLFQFPREQLFGKTVLHDIVNGLKNYGYTEEKAEKLTFDLLERLYLSRDLADRSPLHLSGGEARKVALAGILAVEPSVLVLDEPTIGLDPQSRIELFSLLEEEQERGMTTVIISNSMEDLWDRVDRIIIMDGGRIIADDSSHNILQDKQLLTTAHMVLPGHIAFLRSLEERVGRSFTIPQSGAPMALDSWVGELAKELKL